MSEMAGMPDRAYKTDRAPGTVGEFEEQLSRYESLVDRLRSRTTYVRPMEGVETSGVVPEPVPRSPLQGNIRQLSRLNDALERTVEELDL